MFDGLDHAIQPFFVKPEQLMVWAGRVRPHIEKMAEGSRGRYLASDILVAIAAGRMQLWLALSGPEILCVMLTEIREYPRARALRIIGLVGHDHKKWRHLLSVVELAAKNNFGCTIMEASAPPRFGVLLPGYRSSHTLGEKPL